MCGVYVPDEGLWDILIKDIPKEVTSYTFNMDILRQGVSYDFRIIGVNDYGYGSPSQPSPSVSGGCYLMLYRNLDILKIISNVLVMVVKENSLKVTEEPD